MTPGRTWAGWESNPPLESWDVREVLLGARDREDFWGSDSRNEEMIVRGLRGCEAFKTGGKPTLHWVAISSRSLEERKSACLALSAADGQVLGGLWGQPCPSGFFRGLLCWQEIENRAVCSGISSSALTLLAGCFLDLFPFFALWVLPRPHWVVPDHFTPHSSYSFSCVPLVSTASASNFLDWIYSYTY